MKRSKLSVSELLRQACLYAERDQEEALRAYEPCDGPDDERLKQEMRDFIEQLRAYRLKRWGKSKLEELMDNAESVPIREWHKMKGNHL